MQKDEEHSIGARGAAAAAVEMFRTSCSGDESRDIVGMAAEIILTSKLRQCD